MSEHFYCSDRARPEFLVDGNIVLAGQEAQHIIRVLRKKPGDEVLLFDGIGHEFRTVIEKMDKSTLSLTILETREEEKDTIPELTMAVALPKGERQKWLIEKLTELGVYRYIPVKAERADVKVDADVIERLKRQVIEASKQCGRLRLMEILPEMNRREISERFPFTDEMNELSSIKILAHPITDGQFGQYSFVDLINKLRLEQKKLRHILVVIGPVGGWTDEEVQSAVDDKWPILDLGRQVYRVETAAIVVASLFLHL